MDILFFFLSHYLLTSVINKTPAEESLMLAHREEAVTRQRAASKHRHIILDNLEQNLDLFPNTGTLIPIFPFLCNFCTIIG